MLREGPVLCRADGGTPEAASGEGRGLPGARAARVLVAAYAGLVAAAVCCSSLDTRRMLASVCVASRWDDLPGWFLGWIFSEAC